MGKLRETETSLELLEILFLTSVSASLPPPSIYSYIQMSKLNGIEKNHKATASGTPGKRLYNTCLVGRGRFPGPGLYSQAHTDSLPLQLPIG